MPENRFDANGEIKLEAAMARLEEVLRALDRDGVDLEEALRLYEEGIRLVRVCNDRLDDAERRIKILKLSDGGEIVEENFSDIKERESK
ncbi:MAG: exodeoxyribonuclease VII small subunit [Ruminococcaceae bacterium]|nr:exodeoxyribonuclease VII small subunit [Oscillospiraceae bacterium]